jgi:predicted esterase
MRTMADRTTWTSVFTVVARVATAAAVALALLQPGAAGAADSAGGQQRGRGPGQGAGTGGGTGQRGGQAGGQRGMPQGMRRGGASDTGAASRVQTRSYLFSETNEPLEYAVFVSSKVKATEKSPLVIYLHGLGTPPVPFLRRVAPAAQDAGYIVATPMGYNVQGWYGANGPGGGRGAVRNVGELSEKDVMNVLARMREEFNIDDRRIYLAGQSMGGAGALYLGVKHRDIWAAVAASAPAIRTQHQKPADLEPAVTTPFILIHGDADRAVPVEQSREWAAAMKAMKMTYEYVEIRGGGHSDALEQGAPKVFKFFDKHVK